LTNPFNAPERYCLFGNSQLHNPMQAESVGMAAKAEEL
jgi:hypothetical protein